MPIVILSEHPLQPHVRTQYHGSCPSTWGGCSPCVCFHTSPHPYPDPAPPGTPRRLPYMPRIATGYVRAFVLDPCCKSRAGTRRGAGTSNVRIYTMCLARGGRSANSMRAPASVGMGPPVSSSTVFLRGLMLMHATPSFPPRPLELAGEAKRGTRKKT